MPAVSFVVPTFGRQSILHDTLCQLQEAARALDAEILVVNDSKTLAVEVPSGIQVISNHGSGAASARNTGASAAAGSLLVFVDDDVAVSRQNLERTLALHADDPRACINLNWRYSEELLARLELTAFGRFLLRVGLTDYRGCVPDIEWKASGTFEVSKVTALYLAVGRRDFWDVGGFDTSFRNQGVEDDEFSRRVRRSGRKMLIDASEFVLHNEYDRIDLEPRLARICNGAYNRRHAFELGMTEHETRYSVMRAAIYTALSGCRPALTAFANSLPNARWCDPLYGAVAHALIGTVIFEGYYRRWASSR